MPRKSIKENIDNLHSLSSSKTVKDDNIVLSCQISDAIMLININSALK